jgi:hypothetical protein
MVGYIPPLSGTSGAVMVPFLGMPAFPHGFCGLCRYGGVWQWNLHSLVLKQLGCGFNHVSALLQLSCLFAHFSDRFC